MQREYSKVFSTQLNRDMEMLVFGHAGTKVLIFPTRRGRFYEYENMGLVEALAPKIEEGWLQLFCVDSIDAESLYGRSVPPEGRILRHMQYEQYIIDEVLPLIHASNENPYLIAHGCSFGAFHAVNIALRHPTLFNKIVAFSGRYDLSVSVAWFRDLFDGYYDENIYYHTPNHFLPGVEQQELLLALQQLEVVLTVGNEDPFLESNLRLAGIMNQKHITHHLYLWEGIAHEANDWQKMVEIYL